MLLLLVILAVTGLFVTVLRADREVPSPLALQLEGLRADNGLYFRPELLGPGIPSLAETAYADQVLAMAGRRPQAPSDREMLLRELTGPSVWNRWYIEQIDRATATSTSGLAPERVLDAAQPDGSLLDDVAPAPDVWTRLATTAAGLDVLTAHDVAVPLELRRRMADWVTARSAELSNPYQACAAATAARALGQPVPAAVTHQATTWTPPGALNSDEAVLDVSGYACLKGKPTPTLVRARLSEDIDAFSAFHLAGAWIALGGDPRELSAIADTVLARRLPGGLFAAPARRIGTLDTAYAVTEIRRLTGIPQQDLLLADATEQFVADAGNALDPGALADAALILRRTGRLAGPLAQRAVQALATAPPVTRDTVLTWARWRSLQVQLAPEAPVPRIVSWPVDSRESRLQAWTLLGSVGRAAAPAAYADLLTVLPEVLRRETLSVRELRAGVEALRTSGLAVPVDAVRRALSATKGCPGSPDLYRADVSAGTCDISATADAYWLTTTL
jgi:hypothetical protein